jgi:aryl-alcohol dehydrogenase-like predicted oxidoreductase
MQTIEIPGAGKKMSRLIMGTGDLRVMDEPKRQMFDAYIAAGGNAFDTAHQYRGKEKILGDWIAEKKVRDRVVILCKGAHHDDGSPGPRVNPGAIRKDLSESLERLGTDYIDLYMLHRDDPTVEVGPIIEELNEQLAAGKIRAIGASNWAYRRVQEANEYAEARGLTGFAFSSTNLSLAKANEPRWEGCISADRPTVDWHARTQIPLLSWSAQAGGFFSGHFTPDNRSDSEMVRVYYSEENWERYRRAMELAERMGVPPIRISLAYVLYQAFPTGAIIGPRNPAELEDSVKAMNLRLTQQEVDWLDLRTEEIGR